MSDFVINDANIERLAANPGGPCGTFARKTAYGDSFIAKQTPLDVIPYEEWPDRIADQERNKSSLEHIWADSGMGVLNQGSLNFCWAFSVVGALMIERAMMGLPFERLSPSSVAAPITGYRNVGGYIENAILGCRDTGAAPESLVPMCTLRANDFKPKWREAASKFKVTMANDIPGVDQFINGQRVSAHQIQGSQLLLNRPMPNEITRMAHSMMSIRVLDRYQKLPATDYRRYGVRGLNSWGKEWGNLGWYVMEGGQQVVNHGYVITQASFTE